MKEPNPLVEALRTIDDAVEYERSLPPIGSPERPYAVVVPGWVEDAFIAQGTTAQEVADKTLRYSVKVEVVR